MFKDNEKIKLIFDDYNNEYENITIKEKYEKYPPIQYPMIAISEIANEDVERYWEGSQRINYLAYQIEISCEPTENHSALENVNRIKTILDFYMQEERYKCMRRLSGSPNIPLVTDNNIMVGFLRYECNLDIKTNTIYRR